MESQLFIQVCLLVLDSVTCMPCRSDGSRGSNDMDIEPDDIEASDTVTLSGKPAKTTLLNFYSAPFNFFHTIIFFLTLFNLSSVRE